MYITFYKTDGSAPDVVKARPSMCDSRDNDRVLERYSLWLEAQGETDDGLPSGGYVYTVLLDEIAGISISRDKPVAAEPTPEPAVEAAV